MTPPARPPAPRPHIFFRWFVASTLLRRVVGVCKQHGEGREGGVSDHENELEGLEKSFEAGVKLAKGHRAICLECFAPEGTPIQARVATVPCCCVVPWSVDLWMLFYVAA